MLRFVIALLVATSLSAQTLVWWRTPGTPRIIITSVTPGTPPTLNSGNIPHGLVNGDRIVCSDVSRVPNVNTKGRAAFRVSNVSGSTFQILEDNSTSVVAPGTYDGGGVCGKAALYTLPPNPRLVLNSVLNTYLTDPDGTGPQVAPKVAENPTWDAWTRIVFQTTQCTTGSPCNSGPYTADITGGRQAMMSANVWRADKSKTQELTDVKYWLNNVDGPGGVGFALASTSNLFPHYYGGCAKDMAACGAPDGEHLDSRSWLGNNIAQAYDLVADQMTLGERQTLAKKFLAGIMGDSCTNRLENRPGTVTFVSGNTTVQGVGTNFSASDVGRLMKVRISSAAQWRVVASVTDADTLVLATAPSGSASGVTWTIDRPWADGDCGISWLGAHHGNTPSWYTDSRRGVLGAAVTSANQTTITVVSNADVGKTPPFHLRFPSEIMRVTGISGNDWTVERGKHGTTAAAAYANGTAFVANDYTYFGGGGYSASTFSDGFAKVRLNVQDDTAHNLTWGHTFGTFYVCLAFADVNETARKCAQDGFNFYYDFHYPWYKDMSTWIQSGGTASYLTRVTGWNSLIVRAMQISSGGAIDLSDGNWLLHQAYNYGPFMRPWDLSKKFNYTDSSTIDNYWDPDEYNSVAFLGMLYPTSDIVGWARWHMYQETGSSATVYSRMDSRSLSFLWQMEPNNLVCPSTVDGRKCINYRLTSPPHISTITSDYTPPALPTSSFPRSGYANNVHNGWFNVMSYSSWGPTATVFWNLAFGVSKDHLPGYNNPYFYMLFKNTDLRTDGGYAGCGLCDNSFLTGDNAVGVPTDASRGFALLEDGATGVNASGTRGVISNVDREKATATYSYWRQSGFQSYRAAFGVSRGIRNFLHIKGGMQDYVVIADDYETTASVRLGVNLTFHRLHGDLDRNYTPNITTDRVVTSGTAHPFVNDQPVGVDCLGTCTVAGGLAANTTYYVVNRTAADFQLALTVGGAAVDITSVGTGTQVVALSMNPQFSRTGGNMSYMPTGYAAKLNTNVVIAPATTTYTESTFFHGATNAATKRASTRRVAVNEATPTTGARQWLWVDQASTSHATPMATTTAIGTISANSFGVVIVDSTSSAVAVFDKDGSTANTSVSFTVTGLSGNAPIYATGLAPGTWTGTKGGVGITGATVAADGTWEITGHGNGAFVLTRSGAAAPVDITTTTLPDAPENAAYSVSLSVTGGTPGYTWDVSAGALPTGINLSSAGILSGTPTVDGTFNFTARVTDSLSDIDTQALTLIVQPESTPLTASPSNTNMTGFVGTAFAEGSLSCSGGTAPYDHLISSGQMPDGLVINEDTGAITGTPTRLGDFSVVFKCRDAVAAEVEAATVLFRIHPGGSDFSVVVEPLGTKALVTIRRPGLDSNLDGVVLVRATGTQEPVFNEVITKGAATRQFIVRNLTPLSGYAIEVQIGLHNAGIDFTTGPGLVPRTKILYFSVPSGRSIDNVRLEYGPTEALEATPIVRTCTTVCQITLSDISADDPLWFRYAYRTAANVTVAESGLLVQK